MANSQEKSQEPTEVEKVLQSQLDEANAAREAAEVARDKALEEAKAAKKALGLADPETVAKKMKADYEKGKNYTQLSEKYKMTVAEVNAVLGAL